MRRSFGVTFSAVIVFLGCAFALLCCGFVVVGLVMMKVAPTEQVQSLPRFAYVFEGIGVVFLLGCAGWGIASGVGLLQLRPWSRISMLIFSGLLLFITIPGMLMFLFMPDSLFAAPGLPANFGLLVRLIVEAIYGAIAALGVAWLWYFNTKAVKAEFQPQLARPFDPQTAYAPGNFPLPASAAHTARRPVGITVIGIYMLFGAVSGIFIWPFYRVAIPDMRPYAMFFGLFFRDFPAVLATMIFGGVMAVAGWGLLKLQKWARLVAIWVQIIAVLNVAITLLIPSSRARFSAILQEYQAVAMKNMPVPSVPMPDMSFSVWIGMGTVLPIAAIVIWYLISRKQAYLEAAEKSAGGD